MRLNIKAVVLWSRTPDTSPRVVPFAPGKLNVITGASKTGKSAVIPIIDYCLGSDKCAIPVERIRKACSWFGIVIVTEEGEKLLARREPGDQQSTGDMYLLEGEEVIVPKSIDGSNTNVSAVKHVLDRLAGLSNLPFDPTGAGGGFQGRPSFRDMLAFCFQPQNTIANPDALFFKADTMEHKEKLRTIFPYVLGAVTPEVLARRWELEKLLAELRRRERELTAQRQTSERWRAELVTWVGEARDAGLLDAETAVAPKSDEAVLQVLEGILKKTSADTRVSEPAIQAAAQELAALDTEEGSVALQLGSLRSRAENMTRLRTAVEQYSGGVKQQLERLELSRWLRELSGSADAACPVCAGPMSSAQAELDGLCDALARIESTSRQLAPVPAAFDKEFAEVREELRTLTDRFNAIRTRRAAVEARSKSLTAQRWRRESVDRFLGRTEQAVKVLRAGHGDPALAKEVEALRRRVEELRAASSERDARERERAALLRVSASMARILPNLDSERPNDPAELDIRELTIRVTGKSGRPDYLWEIGSGANWLAYHVASLLALQELFMSLQRSPVPALLVVDQPSQVYFPRRLAAPASEGEDPKLRDEDVAAVRKVFDVLGSATVDLPGLQVIVLDHAGREVWGDAPSATLVAEWRNGDALIPTDWR